MRVRVSVGVRRFQFPPVCVIVYTCLCADARATPTWSFARAAAVPRATGEPRAAAACDALSAAAYSRCSYAARCCSERASRSGRERYVCVCGARVCVSMRGAMPVTLRGGWLYSKHTEKTLSVCVGVCVVRG